MTALPETGPGVGPRGPYVRGAIGALRYRLTGHRMPLALTARITWRCDALCAGCGMPNLTRPELSTQAWVGVLDDAARLGCVRVCFTGGEPLLRDDLGDLVDRCAALGLATTLETNGARLGQRARFLRSVGQVMVPVEGRPEVHDALREPGSYASALAGLNAARDAGISISTVTTLCTKNSDPEDLNAALQTAERLGGTAMFQLLHAEAPLASRAARRLHLAPDAMRAALQWVLGAQAAGRPVGVSEQTLRYLMTWPDLATISLTTPHEDVLCSAGNLHCVVDADGAVLPCVLRVPPAGVRGPNVADAGFAAAFASLVEQPCRACAVAPLVEYNYLLNLDRRAMVARLRQVRTPLSPWSAA
ncbi:MAG: radical SAM protein [Myxococcales bacterium]|nr:radical SAM protein [Myxococcales bacterium]